MIYHKSKIRTSTLAPYPSPNCLQWLSSRQQKLLLAREELRNQIRLDIISEFIQASMSKIQALFKDFSSLANSFQGLKFNEKY